MSVTAGLVPRIIATTVLERTTLGGTLWWEGRRTAYAKPPYSVAQCGPLHA